MNPDAIIVLAAGIKQIQGQWMSSDLTEEDNKQGAPGGALRVAATSILSERYPNATIVASGGKGFDVPKDAPQDRPLLCEILKRELVTRGVSEDRIECEGLSNTTYQQLQQIHAIIGNRKWTHVLIVSNRWHLPRVSAMLKTKFSMLHANVELISAEEVLIANDVAQWESSIAQEYKSAYMIQRIAREKRGAEQIIAGTSSYR